MTPQAPPSLDELRRLAPKLQSLASAHGARELRVFGSVARDGAQLNSDLDLQVDVQATPGLEQYMDLKLVLEDLLNLRVDLVTGNGLRAELRDRIDR
ncbi:MAG: nucleotidyltransferase family protein [Cyanobium sp.]